MTNKEKLNKAYETIGRLACQGVRFHNLGGECADPVEVVLMREGLAMLELKIAQKADEMTDELICRVAAVAKAAVG